MNKYAVVTGASRGLGKSFARELAQRGFNLVLVSLPDEGLAGVGAHLQEKYTIEVHTYETNLTEKDSVLALTEWINKRFSVFLLINNAAFGGSKQFENVSIKYLDEMIKLNARAPVLLTHQLLPNLQKQEDAYILNVSSLAGLSPMGYKTVYPASKSFLHSFSIGLYEEFKNTNVCVSVVHPGPMKTTEENTNRLNQHGTVAKIIVLDPDAVAVHSIKHLFNKDKVIKVSYLSRFVLKIAPSWIKLPLMTRKMKKEAN